MELAQIIGGDNDLVEPRAETISLEDTTAKLLRPILLPVVNQPTTGNKVPVDIVEVIAFLGGIDIALVLVPGVVGILPLGPAIFIEEFLRHIPFAH